MAARTDDFDLGALRLSPGEGRRLELDVGIEPLVLATERYTSEPACVPVVLDVSRMLGGGYALHLSFEAAVAGPCMRCLKPAAPRLSIEAREVDRPGTGRASTGERPLGADDDLESPYVHDETLDLAGWVRDAFALALPVKILCREDCPGLCPVCAMDLNDLDPARPEHTHERAPDPRWAKLSELKLE
jgi:uncharacterized protein